MTIRRLGAVIARSGLHGLVRSSGCTPADNRAGSILYIAAEVENTLFCR